VNSRLRHACVSHARDFHGYARLGEEVGAPWFTRQQKQRARVAPVIIRGVPHYVTLMRWTSQGVAGLPAWRERVEEGERIIADAGGTLVGVYVTLGRYDVVEIFEAPNDETAAEIIMKLQRHGAEHTETLRAFTRDEAEEIIRRV
jgi:uncharacterized protein with GYD domain